MRRTQRALRAGLIASTAITLGWVGSASGETLTVPIYDGGSPGNTPVVLNRSIDGGAASAIQAVGYGDPLPFNGTIRQLIIGSGVNVQGAIAIEALPGGAFRGGILSLDNSGTLRSTSGPAIVGLDTNWMGVLINNRASGVINGINAIGPVTNAGLIDGGSGTAITYRPQTNQRLVIGTALNNSGVIRSNGTAATLVRVLGGSNSGLIENLGTGLVFEGGGAEITNEASGRIATGGAVALSGRRFALVNRGTIVGSVVVTETDPFATASTIDTVGGTIQGDLLLGATNDTLTAQLDSNFTLVTGVTGRVDGGAGIDTVKFDVSTSGSLKTFAAPSNFEKLAFGLKDGAQLTLDQPLTMAVEFSGAGTLINNGAVTTTGRAFDATKGSSGLYFVNKGAITATALSPPPFSPPGSVDAAVLANSLLPCCGNGLYLGGFTNEGSVMATGGDGVSVSLGTSGVFTNKGSITATGRGVIVTNAASISNSGTIRSTGDTGAWLQAASIVNSGAIEGVSYGATVEVSNIENSGQIRATGGVGLRLYGRSSLVNRTGGVISGTTAAITTEAGEARLTNAGTINGDVVFNASFSNDVFVDSGGVVNGSVYMGRGADIAVLEYARMSGNKYQGVTGVLDGGDEDGQPDTVIFVVRQDSVLTQRLASFEQIGVQLVGGARASLTLTGTQEQPFKVFGTGSLDLTANLSNTYYSLFDFGGLSVSAPASKINLTSRGALSATYVFGGTSAVDLGASSFTNAGTFEFSTPLAATNTTAAINGGERVTNSGTITLTNATAVRGALEFVNTGTIRQSAPSTIRNSAAVVNVASVTNSGRIEVGADAISFQNASGQNGGATILNQAAGVIASTRGAAIRTSTGADRLTNQGSITGLVDLGAGSDTVENLGTITGDVNLGLGDDTFIQGGTVSGIIDGGMGSDTFTLTGTAASAPANLTNIRSFEVLAMGAGMSRLDGTVDFPQLTVNQGALFGLAGSVINAPRIDVGAGGTFGSAGVVNGNLFVAGTLSPGASPGTMTVNGNVSLLAGSTTLFEFTRTISDKLIVSGTVSIANTATLRLTGALTPGVRLDLITAGGGITGAFGTVDKGGLNAVLVQTADKIQLVSLFGAATGLPRNAAATVDYLNQSIGNGAASGSLLAAFPSLLTSSGGNDAVALRQVSPEAYATSLELLAGEGLAVARAARDGVAAPQDAGVFFFGQAVAGGGDIAGQAGGALGVDSEASGLTTGLGFGSQSAWGGVFVGNLKGEHDVAGLGVRAESEHVLIGAQGGAAIGAFEAGATLVYDQANIDTQRALPGGARAVGEQQADSVIGDVYVAYRAALGEWTITPSLSATYVKVSRDALTESGASPFALQVAASDFDRTFLGGEVRVERQFGAVRPWVSVGYRDNGDDVPATTAASYAGLPASLTAEGVLRSGSATTAGVGVEFEATSTIRLHARYRGEFGDDKSSAFLIGASARF